MIAHVVVELMADDGTPLAGAELREHVAQTTDVEQNMLRAFGKLEALMEDAGGRLPPQLQVLLGDLDVDEPMAADPRPLDRRPRGRHRGR